ncbi:MAG: twin-arginine translocase subunit TatC [Chitinophagaceae bacterium]|nr:twin-arginine translocase subunit TatC [Chitinophagaceae bacterium]
MSNTNSEASFIDHLEALRWHIVRSLIAIMIFSVVAFIYITPIFDKIILGPTNPNFISYRLFCKLGKLLHIDNLCMTDVAIDFQNTQLSGQFMMSLTSAMVFGFIMAFPYVAYEIWKFIKPALTEKEKKMSTGFIFWVSVLFLLGICFGYYIITPYTINFFATYQISDKFKNIIKIDDYLSNVMNLSLGTGIVFEMPVVVFFLSKLGLLTPTYMREYRKYAVVIILFLAAIITPSPDVISQFIVALPMWILYEISIYISAIVKKEKDRKNKEFFSS